MQLSRILSLAVALTIGIPSLMSAHTTLPVAIKDPCPSCKTSIKTLTAFVLFAMAYIRLNTKSCPKEQIERSWGEYMYRLVSLLNVTRIFNSEYWIEADDIIIGIPLKLITKEMESQDETGITVTLTDKTVKTFPSGMFGYFDAYVIQNLKNLFESIDNLKKCGTYFDGICW